MSPPLQPIGGRAAADDRIGSVSRDLSASRERRTTHAHSLTEPGCVANSDGRRDGVLQCCDDVQVGRDGVLQCCSDVHVGGDGVQVGGDGVQVGGDGVQAGGDGIQVGGHGVQVGSDDVQVGSDGVQVGRDGVTIRTNIWYIRITKH